MALNHDRRQTVATIRILDAEERRLRAELGATPFTITDAVLAAHAPGSARAWTTYLATAALIVLVPLWWVLDPTQILLLAAGVSRQERRARDVAG